jgi:hypothetical protein
MCCLIKLPIGRGAVYSRPAYISLNQCRGTTVHVCVKKKNIFFFGYMYLYIFVVTKIIFFYISYSYTLFVHVFGSYSIIWTACL